MSDVTQNRLWQKLNLVKESYRGIAQRRINSACIYGPPGVGKTFLARRLIPGIVTLRPRTESVIDTLYEHRNEPAALIEEADYFFNSEPLLNIAKIVLDSNEPRVIHDPRKEGYGTFEVHTPIVFGTNKNLHDHAQFLPKMRVHVEALVSRLTVMIGLSYDPIDCYEYAVWLATAGDGGVPLLKKHGLSLDASNEVLRFFAENAQTLDEISPRRLDMIAALRRKFPASWKALSLERCVARRAMPKVTPHVIVRPARATLAPATDTDEIELEPEVVGLEEQAKRVAQKAASSAEPEAITSLGSANRKHKRFNWGALADATMLRLVHPKPRRGKEPPPEDVHKTKVMGGRIYYQGNQVTITGFLKPVKTTHPPTTPRRGNPLDEVSVMLPSDTSWIKAKELRPAQ